MSDECQLYSGMFYRPVAVVLVVSEDGAGSPRSQGKFGLE